MKTISNSTNFKKLLEEMIANTVMLNTSKDEIKLMYEGLLLLNDEYCSTGKNHEHIEDLIDKLDTYIR